MWWSVKPEALSIEHQALQEADAEPESECNKFSGECHLRKERARSRVRQRCHQTEMPTRWRLCRCSGTKKALTQWRSSVGGNQRGHPTTPLWKPTLRRLCLGCPLSHSWPRSPQRTSKLTQTLKKLMLPARHTPCSGACEQGTPVPATQGTGGNMGPHH